MKKFIFLLLCSSILWANDKKTPSTIKEVVVYLQGAQISRETNINIPKGISEVLLSDLSPIIDENSIQISGLKSASILSINYKINYLEKKVNSQKIVSLEKQLKEKNKSIAQLKNHIKGLQEEEALLSANKELKSTAQSISLAKLMEFAAYFRKRITGIKDDIYATNEKIDLVTKERTAINLELTQLKDGNEEERGEILLKINTPEALSLRLNFTYKVSDAGWFPSYDIKAKNTQQPLSFYYKAHVYQQTGVDWKDVKITLSTGNPTTNNNKPELNPKYLNFVNSYTNKNAVKRYQYKYNPTIRKVSGRVTDANGLSLPGVNIIVKGNTRGTQTDFDGNYTLTIPQGQKELEFSYIGNKNVIVPIYSGKINISMEEDTEALEEVVITGYGRKKTRNLLQGSVSGIAIEDKGIAIPTATGDTKQDNITATVFNISKPYSIPSVNDASIIEIDIFNADATYEYFTAPLLNENVFLTAKIKQWERFDLLSGEASIYFEGNYAGKTYIDPFLTEDELTISLGVDPNVVVERRQLNNLKDKSFIGNTRIVNKAYEITVKNNKRTSVALVLMDRVPISQNKEIKVDDMEYGKAEYDDKKGLITWRLQLDSKVSEKKHLSYRLKYPKNRRINY